MRVHRDWLLTPERVAIHMPTAMAVVADLHLGYDRARQRRGEAVPLTGLDELFDALTRSLLWHGWRRLVIAGDLVEDATGHALLPDLLHWLDGRHLELTAIVPGNHDRGLARAVPSLPLRPEGVSLGEWHVVHGDAAPPPGRVVMGHLHPCLRWGLHIAAPCYLIAADRIVLPAFSPDAAGVNVLRARRWRGYRCGAIAGDRVLDFGDVAHLAAARRTAARSGSRPR
jgi:putative SbcD/Mre11-related phosphoesterase